MPVCHLKNYWLVVAVVLCYYFPELVDRRYKKKSLFLNNFKYYALIGID